jgi:glycerate kinase
MARGLERAGWEVDRCPLAGGGAGTVEALLLALGGATADGFALVEDGATAITEDPARIADAAASGAELVVCCAAGRSNPPPMPIRPPDARLLVLSDASTDVEAWRAAGATTVDGTAFVRDALDFDRRLRGARALVLGRGTLERADLRSTLGEAATRARQTGVPAHAIVGVSRLDLFDQRILDIQHVLEARTSAEVEAAAERLAAVL